MTMPSPETLVDSLIEHDVVTVDDEADTVATTDSFEETRELYHDIYVAVSDVEFERTVADLFELDTETAATAIESGDVTREQVITYLSLRSYVDEPVPAEELAMMAAVVTDVGPGSAVPDGLHEIDDENYTAFLADHPSVVVTVWKRHCDPCDAMKAELDDVLARAPNDIEVVGIEHVPPSAFRREFRVDAAPAVLLFRDGKVEESFEGRTDPETLGDAFDAVYRVD